MQSVMTISAFLQHIDRVIQDTPQAFVKQYHNLLVRYYNIPSLLEALSGDGPDGQRLRTASQLISPSNRPSKEIFKAPALPCIFSQLSVDRQIPSARYYPIRPLSATKECFPSTAVADAGPALQEQRKAFYREMDQIAQNPPVCPTDFEILFDTVFQKYTWCISSSAEADVSLYDEARLTVAIASCLPEDGRKPSFLLVSGDFSGIQKYIFAAARTSAREVSRRLRARSFLIDATITALAHAASHRFGVSAHNILMLCGGKFQMLIPDQPDQEKKLAQFRDEINNYLFTRYKGEINVNLAWVSFGPEGFSDYGATVSRLAQELRSQKIRPFHGQLMEQSGWSADRFFLYDQLAGKTACPCCGSRLIPVGQTACDECSAQANIGSQLTRASRLWYSRQSGEVELLPNYYLSFSRDKSGEPYQVIQVDSWSIPPDMTCYPLSIRPMANHLPVDIRSGEALTFSDLAERSKGSKYLGVLKADVDNLGYLFADGFRNQAGQQGSVGRVTSMSRMLELFFSGYVNTLIHQKPYANIYSVFSGGDDLFLVGPWDLLPDFAVDLERDFRLFAGENPCVTLSGALLTADPKTHIATLSDECEELLKSVKNDDPGQIYPEKHGRDAVYFLGQTFAWPDLRTQLENGRKLQEATGQVSTSILRRIMRYSQMYKDFLETHDVFQLMYDPLFFYDRKRNYGKISYQRGEWFLRYVDQLQDNAADYTHPKKELYFAQTAIRYALNRTKEVREYGMEQPAEQ